MIKRMPSSQETMEIEFGAPFERLGEIGMALLDLGFITSQEAVRVLCSPLENSGPFFRTEEEFWDAYNDPERFRMTLELFNKVVQSHGIEGQRG